MKHKIANQNYNVQIKMRSFLSLLSL